MINIKLTNSKKTKSLYVMFFMYMFLLFACGKTDNIENGSGEYDPSKPIELNSFYPDSGIYLEKVILTGKNFGTDPEQIRVWFNSRKAPVIGSTGTKMYVLAPRLPGDTCTISVAIGNDSVVYDQKFRYFTSVTVTTIAGNGNHYDYRDGDLSQSILQPRYLCVDNENNIFISTRGFYDGNNGIVRINEEKNELITIAMDMSNAPNVPAVDPETGVVTIMTETTVGSFLTLDPKEMWAPRTREMKWPPEGDRPPEGYKHSVVVNPSDGYLYTRYYFGHIVKIDPKTYEVETIYKTPQGDSYGLTFTPQEPNILYMSFWSNAGVNANSICSIDVTDPENTFKRVSSSLISGGHRDGPLETAQFKDPCQIFCDSEGNIYIADYSNHCIRRITPEKMVETVLGIPGMPGWKDGGKEEALFNFPRGIGISKDGTVYVGDLGNARVRKLSIN